MDDILTIEQFDSLISPYKSNGKVIEFLWMYEFCGSYDYAYIECNLYIESTDKLEKKFIGHVEILPNNFEGYYEKLAELAMSFGQYAEQTYGFKCYFPSSDKIDCGNISWEQAHESES